MLTPGEVRWIAEADVDPHPQPACLLSSAPGVEVRHALARCQLALHPLIARHDRQEVPGSRLRGPEPEQKNYL